MSGTGRTKKIKAIVGGLLIVECLLVVCLGVLYRNPTKNGFVTWGGPSYESARDVAVAGDGSIYLAGNTYSFGMGDYDAFLAKYDAAGTHIWSSMWGKAYTDSGNGVAVASDGFVYLAGYYCNVMGNVDAFLRKYNALGTQLWTRTIGGVSLDVGTDVAVANDGSIYLAGYTGSFGVGGDTFLAKYNAAGTQIWNRTWGGLDCDGGGGMTDMVVVEVGGDGSVYLAGYTDSFGAGLADTFLAKYDASGTQLWNQTWGGSSYDKVNSVTVARDGSIYLAGYTCSFGASNSDAFLLKYNAAGTLLWSLTRGGMDYDQGSDVAISTDGCIYLTGFSYGTGEFSGDTFLAKYATNGVQLWSHTWVGSKISVDGVVKVAVASDGSVYQAGNTNSFGAGDYDAFLAKYDPSGNNSWDITWLINTIWIIFAVPWILIGAIILIDQRSKSKAMPEKLAARRNPQGKVPEVVYHTQPARPSTQNPANPASCRACGALIPVIDEEIKFCVSCGKPLK